MKYSAIVALGALTGTTLAAPAAEAPARRGGLVGLNVPVLSGGDSTAHCNHGEQLVNLNAPVMGTRKRRLDGLLGGHGKTLVDLSLPLLSGGKSTQKCEDGDVIDVSVPLLSGREDKE
ncbi:hypothetical protein NLG97_g6752 [Lecanicillium saksenae]|uniref:Uncharacterized protein n=1 Tax=Lecanicillium saksenae TaxID=468837 RepID=A0ACC1QPB6_9HYPO|nr:hypothetical protein NLG97_g6752 [Lecanicillium saksenae]